MTRINNKTFYLNTHHRCICATCSLRNNTLIQLFFRLTSYYSIYHIYTTSSSFFVTFDHSPSPSQLFQNDLVSVLVPLWSNYSMEMLSAMANSLSAILLCCMHNVSDRTYSHRGRKFSENRHHIWPQ